MTHIHPFSIKAYAGGKHPTAPLGEVVLHTWHDTEGSRDIEVQAFRSRMARGEIAYIDVIDHEVGRTDRVFHTGATPDLRRR